MIHFSVFQFVTSEIRASFPWAKALSVVHNSAASENKINLISKYVGLKHEDFAGATSISA